MNRLWLLLSSVLIGAAPAWAGPGPIPERTSQVVVVTSPDWQSITGRLQRYEKTGGRWQSVGAAWPIVLGRSGLGWGQGLPLPPTVPPMEGPRKREGDGRSPAGVFRLTEAYGYAERPVAGSTFPYRGLGERDRCVDDPAAREYNRVVTIGPSQPETWASAETMRRDDELYRWVVFVAHNSEPPQPGGGSCIFLHVWGGAKSPTAGCTAMEVARLEDLLGWLKPEANPVLVQLPEGQYRQVRTTWQLPDYLF